MRAQRAQTPDKGPRVTLGWRWKPDAAELLPPA